MPPLDLALGRPHYVLCHRQEAPACGSCPGQNHWRAKELKAMSGDEDGEQVCMLAWGRNPGSWVERQWGRIQETSNGCLHTPAGFSLEKGGSFICNSPEGSSGPTCRETGFTHTSGKLLYQSEPQSSAEVEAERSRLKRRKSRLMHRVHR